MRACQPKDTKRRDWRRERERKSTCTLGREREKKSTCTWGLRKEREPFGSSFYVFSFPLGLPYANWA